MEKGKDFWSKLPLLIAHGTRILKEMRESLEELEEELK
jgi:hypothetical protein